MKVVAYKQIDNKGVLELYGYGTIDETLRPAAEPYLNMKNRNGEPRTFGLITLEDGKTIWSFQCRWALKKTFERVWYPVQGQEIIKIDWNERHGAESIKDMVFINVQESIPAYQVL